MKTSVLAGAAVMHAAGSGSVLAGGSAAASRDDVRALVAEVLSDADQRTSLLGDGSAGGGHDGKNFVLADASGAFKLVVASQIQFRYQMNFRDSQEGGTNAAPGRVNDDFESGFEARRTRLIFKGNIVDPKLFYYIQGDFSRSGGDFGLLDAYAGYKYDGGFTLKWGQFKSPFMREELVSDMYQLAIERTSMNTAFSQDRSQGVEGGYRNDHINLALAFTDGFNSKNSEFGTVNGLGNFGFVRGGRESDWALTGRLDWKVAGDWKQFETFTSEPGSGYGCLLGVAGHVEGSANDIGANVEGTDTQGDTIYSSWTVDMSVEGDGWNLFAAGVGAYQNTGLQGFSDRSTADYGLAVQGGFYLPDTDWELFARYDAIFQDSDRDPDGSDDSFDTVTFGTNYYWAGQAAKFSFDVQWFLDESTALMTSNSGNGFLRTTEENEVNLRFQFQILF